MSILDVHHAQARVLREREQGGYRGYIQSSLASPAIVAQDNSLEAWGQCPAACDWDAGWKRATIAVVANTYRISKIGLYLSIHSPVSIHMAAVLVLIAYLATLTAGIAGDGTWWDCWRGHGFTFSDSVASSRRLMTA